MGRCLSGWCRAEPPGAAHPAVPEPVEGTGRQGAPKERGASRLALSRGPATNLAGNGNVMTAGSLPYVIVFIDAAGDPDGRSAPP
jgi:hypothetical protein